MSGDALACVATSCVCLALCWLAGMMQSVPHALDEHVPALAGPLPVASAAGEEQREGGSLLTRMAGSGDAAQALLLSR